MPDLKSGWDPKRYQVRRPTDLAQGVGRIVNPPRTQKVGGIGEASILPVTKSQSKTHLGPDGKGPVSDRGKPGQTSGKRGK